MVDLELQQWYTKVRDVTNSAIFGTRLKIRFGKSSAVGGAITKLTHDLSLLFLMS